MATAALILASGDTGDLIAIVVVAVLAGLGSLIQAAVKKAEEKRVRAEYERRRRISEGTELPPQAGAAQPAPTADPMTEAAYTSSAQPRADDSLYAGPRQQAAARPQPPPLEDEDVVVSGSAAPQVRIRRPRRQPTQAPLQPTYQPMTSSIMPQAAAAPAQPSTPPARLGVAAALADPRQAARAFIYQEIFAPPKALRSESPLWDR